MMRSAADRCKRARNNVKFLDLPPSLRRPYILTAYRTNHDLRSCLRSLFQVSATQTTLTLALTLWPKDCRRGTSWSRNQAHPAGTFSPSP